jgi:glutathione S-transferase
LPVITDGAAVVSESAAIGLYLADRYSSGVLAPKLDDPARGAYLRWIFFAPSVIEPAAAAKPSGGNFNAGAVGWGTYEAMVGAAEAAIGKGPWLLGERFTMADVIFGGTLRYMLMFKMIEPKPAFEAYVARLEARPAYQRSAAKNAAVMAEHGLGK